MSDSSNTKLSTETKIETSFSNEWKFQLSDPVANSIGSALYLELGVGADEYEIEGKIILDERINKNFFAMNIVCELELETELEKEDEKIECEIEWETPIEIDLAYMHFFKPTFGLGLEVRSMNGIAKEKGWENSVIFAGPTLFFSQNRFFGIC